MARVRRLLRGVTRGAGVARVRPHVKIHLTMKSHRKTAAIWDDNDLLACYVRLLELGMSQFAAKRGGVITLTRVELMEVTRKRRVDVALTLVQRLADIASMSVQHRGDVASILVRNYAKKQGIGEKNGPRTAYLRSQNTDSEYRTKSRSRKPAPTEGVPDWALDLARTLAEKVIAQRPGTDVPTATTPKRLAAWGRGFAKIHARGPSPEEIAKRVEWVFSPANLEREKYAIVARSPTSFDEKWGRIQDAMLRVTREVGETMDMGNGKIEKRSDWSEEQWIQMQIDAERGYR